MERAEWKLFRNALDKSERKEFDEMWDIPRLYVSACSNSVQLVPLQPIIISILFHHFKELKVCMEEIKQLDAKCSNQSGRILLMVGEEIQEEKARTRFVASNDNNDCQLDVFFGS